MKNQIAAAILLASVSIVCAANFGAAVIDYNHGEGFATDFATGAGYTNAISALGDLSKSTPPPFASPVTPYNPPYGGENIVSIGTGGSLTLQFSAPVFNHPLNPYGIDFIAFGNSGFVITNGVFTEMGITDGSLFSANPGVTEVWVSADNVTYYQLAPASAPNADGYFPTDASGDPQIPVDPGLRASDFSGRTLAGIRERYRGSAGGVGFDIGTARTVAGALANLDKIQFVRFKVISGVIEVDAISAVAETHVFEETFTRPTDWKTFGGSDLFRVNEGALEATWDTDRENSYYYRPLGRTLRKRDSFSVEMDIAFESLSVDHENFYAFEIAMGFFNEASATKPEFDRSTGMNSPNLVEWDYFPDTGFGATIAPAVASTNSQFEAAFTFPLEIAPGAYRLRLAFDGTNGTLRTSMTRDGQNFGTIKDVKLSAGFTDFAVDAFAIMNYFDRSNDGRVQARARIDNVVITLPKKHELRLMGGFADNTWRVTFQSQRDVRYQLQRSDDLRDWTSVGASTVGSGAPITLVDPANQSQRAFYRVLAEEIP